MPVSSLRPDSDLGNSGTGSGVTGAADRPSAVADESDASFIDWQANPIVSPSDQFFGFDDLPNTARRIITHTYSTRWQRQLGASAFGQALINNVASASQNPGAAPSVFVTFNVVDLTPVTVPFVNNPAGTGCRVANGSGNEAFRQSRIEWLVTWASGGGARETDMASVVLPLLFGLGRGLNLFSENMAHLESVFRRTIGDGLPGRLYWPNLTSDVPELADERRELLWLLFKQPKFVFFGGK